MTGLPFTLPALLSIGAVWKGRDHAVHARPFLPVDRGQVLLRLAAREDSAAYWAEVDARRIGPVEPLGYSGDLLPPE